MTSTARMMFAAWHPIQGYDLRILKEQEADIIWDLGDRKMGEGWRALRVEVAISLITDTSILITKGTTMKPAEMLRAEDAAAADPKRDQSKPLPSFVIRDLSVLAYANGFTLWHYKAGTIANLLSSNFFGDCSDMMAKGDHMHVSAPDGNAILAIESSDAGVVSVRKMVARSGPGRRE